MSATFTELPDLLNDPRLDPADIATDDWRAFHCDMLAIPVGLPSAAEVVAMARSLGLTEPPF